MGWGFQAGGELTDFILVLSSTGYNLNKYYVPHLCLTLICFGLLIFYPYFLHFYILFYVALFHFVLHYIV